VSTKCTIGYGDSHHLYEECFDPDRIYLLLEGSAMTSQLEIARDEKEHRLTVGIDIAIWRQIVEAWLKSHWAQHPERDYDRTPPDLDALERFFERLGTKESP